MYYLPRVRGWTIPKKGKKEVQTMREKHIERLYKLLERAEREHDTDTAAALRWVIFALENG